MAATDINSGYSPNTEWVEFQRIQNTKVEKAILDHPRWAQFTGMYFNGLYTANGQYSSKDNARPKIGEVIAMKGEFTTKKSLVMDMSVLYPSRGKGVRGNEQLKGNEQRGYFAHMTTAVNGLRYAHLDQDGMMEAQYIPSALYTALRNGANMCKQWLSDYVGYDPLFAILMGYAPHLLGTNAQGGLNLTAKSHPNILVKGYGSVTSPTTFNATHETNVATALASLTGAPGQSFDLQFVDDLVYFANQKKVQPALGQKHLIWVKRAAIRSLKQDPAWRTLHMQANVRGLENPAISGFLDMYPCDNAILVVDNTIPSAAISGDTASQGRAYDSDRTAGASTVTSAVQYHNDDYITTPVDAGHRCPAILLGKQAIMSGMAVAPHLDMEDDDYKAKKGTAISTIYGYSRSDIYDGNGELGTAGNFVENNSSVVGFTYDKDVIEYN